MARANLFDEMDREAEAHRVSEKRAIEGPEFGVQPFRKGKVGGVVCAPATETLSDCNDLLTVLVKRVANDPDAPDRLPSVAHVLCGKGSGRDKTREGVCDFIGE